MLPRRWWRGIFRWCRFAAVAALVAGAVIYATGWMPIDPILSLAVAALILRSTLALLKESVGVLMEGVPPLIIDQK